MNRSHDNLSRRERQIMEVVFQQGETTVADVVAAIPDAPSYNSIRNLMTLMERKGHLSHRVDGVRYLYRPTTAPAQAARHALWRVVETFFAGSVEQTVTALLSHEETQLSEEEVARIEALIAAARAANLEGNPLSNEPDSPATLPYHEEENGHSTASGSDA